MTDILVKRLPTDIVNFIKLYTGELYMKDGRFHRVTRISSDDPRYEMLKKRPRIRKVTNDYKQAPWKGSVWFKLNTGKFMVINVRESHVWNGINYWFGYVWAMHYNEAVTNVLL